MSITARLVLGSCAVVLLALLILPITPNGAITLPILAVLGVAVAAGMIAGGSISGSLSQLSSAARSIATGATPRFPRSKIPEVDRLVRGLREMHSELTDRIEELDREKAAGTTIVDTMSEGIIASDGTGKIVIANPAARDLLSYRPDEALPNLQTLFRAKEAREAVDEVLMGASVQDRIVMRDGKTLAINARSVGEAGAVLVIRDLTEVRQLEAIRKDFVANVSHELKTPLTSIAGYAETLADASIPDDDRRRFLNTIRSNAARMQSLVDDLLDLSRIESGSWTPRPETVQLDVAVQDAWWQVADRANLKEINFESNVATDAGQLYADPHAIGQILGNLFDNAIRYVETGGVISFTSSREGEMVVLSVADNGPGIPSEHLPRIFERFYRVDPSRSRAEGGTGLGLSIVRHMVESHGGSASVESVLREGTIVSCRFPVTLS